MVNTSSQSWLLSSSKKQTIGGILCALLILAASGCQQGTVSTLLGRWVGHPDTAAARGEREAIKYGRVQAPEISDEKAVKPARVTDWEKYEVTVLFDFLSADRVEIALEGNEDIQKGSWKIVASTPAGCTIEVKTEPSSDLSSDETLAENEPRRFELELDERDGKCVGFLLSEVGADRQLGTLYFSRLN